MNAPRKSDNMVRMRQLQRLAIAAGMSLSSGLPVVVGGAKCPSVRKIKTAIGFDAQRMTRAQYSDAKDDYGATRPYYGVVHDGGQAISDLLDGWSGVSDCDGEMSLRDYLLIC